MNGIISENIRKNELKISGRKDWIIFWFFAVMVSYVRSEERRVGKEC